jgi:hypothetical protein
MSRWLEPLEERKVSAGHWHIEGYCAVRMGHSWSIKRLTGCQGEGTDNPRECARWRSSLTMVRDMIRAERFN